MLRNGALGIQSFVIGRSSFPRGLGLSCEDDTLDTKLRGVRIGTGWSVKVQCFIPQEEKLPPGDMLVKGAVEWD